MGLRSAESQALVASRALAGVPRCSHAQSAGACFALICLEQGCAGWPPARRSITTVSFQGCDVSLHGLSLSDPIAPMFAKSQGSHMSLPYELRAFRCCHRHRLCSSCCQDVHGHLSPSRGCVGHSLKIWQAGTVDVGRLLIHHPFANFF